MKEIVCSLCGKKIGIKAFVLHLKRKHHEYSANHGQKYYDTFIDNSDHKCPLCDKEKHFHSITYGYDTTCSVEHANVLRGIKIKESGSRKGIGKGIKKVHKQKNRRKEKVYVC